MSFTELDSCANFREICIRSSLCQNLDCDSGLNCERHYRTEEADVLSLRAAHCEILQYFGMRFAIDMAVLSNLKVQHT